MNHPRVVIAFPWLALFLAWAAPVSSQSVPKCSVHEVTLTAAGSYANPYTDLAPDAVLTEPDGRSTRTTPLFWDGGATWKFRFSPDKTGTWQWKVQSPDRGLDGQTGSFKVVESARSGSIRPMIGHPCHFQRQDGTPFWFMGDTAWALYTDNEADRHNRRAVEQYIDRRASQGFNVFHSMLLSEAGWGNQGGPPFDDIGAEKINPGYWQEVDHRLACANRQGIVAGLALAWGDKRKVEPYAWRRFPDLDARKRYARYIAARYSAYDVYFLVSGEWHAEIRTRSNATPEAVRREFIEIGNALAAADPHGRMIAIHPMTAAGSVREFTVAPWMAFADYQQNYLRLHDRILLSRQLCRPVVNGEYAYYLRDSNGDGQVDKPNSLTVDDIRHASWDIATAGGYFVTGFGTTYFGGNRDPGPFDLDAKKNAVWESQVQHLKTFFSALAWWTLAPADLLVSADTPRSDDRTLKSERNGRSVSVERPAETTYWAMVQPGELYVLYVRGLDSLVELSLEAAHGQFQVRQFDPRTGAYTDLGKRHVDDRFEYKAPDRQDWVVVLRRVETELHSRPRS